MPKSQQTFSKGEKEKKRLKKRQDKIKKMEARKIQKQESGSKGIQFAYVDHNGNLTDTPPDPSLKVEYKVDNINISVPKKEELEPEELIKNGKLTYYDSSKGFGFIIDSVSGQKYFTHVSEMIGEISVNDKVTFETARGSRGMNAVKVKKI